MTKLILTAPARCVKVLLAVVLPTLPPPPLIGGEDDVHSTNAISSPTALAHAVCQTLNARALSDRPLLAGHVGSKAGKGDGGNNDSNAGGGSQELDCAPDQDGPPLPSPIPKWRRDSNKGGKEVKAKATKRLMAMATRVASDNKGNGNGNEGGGQATATRAMAVVATVVGEDEGNGVAGDEEGEGGMARVMVTRMADKRWQWQQRGRW